MVTMTTTAYCTLSEILTTGLYVQKALMGQMLVRLPNDPTDSVDEVRL